MPLCEPMAREGLSRKCFIPHPHPCPPLEGEGGFLSIRERISSLFFLSIRERIKVRVGFISFPVNHVLYFIFLTAQIGYYIGIGKIHEYSVKKRMIFKYCLAILQKQVSCYNYRNIISSFNIFKKRGIFMIGYCAGKGNNGLWANISYLGHTCPCIHAKGHCIQNRNIV